MPAPPPGRSIDPNVPLHESSESPQLFEMLHRPIVFTAPQRVVHPPSWLGHIPFAFWIVDVLRPSVLVELGTHSGNSYAAFAQAIQMLGLPAAAYAVDTWQGDSQAGFYSEDVYTDFAAYHDRHYTAFSRLVRTTFEDAAGHFSDGSIDLLHIDGCHIYENVVADFALWRPKMSSRGVVLFHDVNIRERDFGAWRLWEELKAQQLATFEFHHGHGLGVLGLGADLPDPLRWLFSRGSDTPDDVRETREFFARLGRIIEAGFTADETARELRATVERAASQQAAHAAAAAEQAAQAEARLSAQDAAHAQALAERDARIAEEADAARNLRSGIRERDLRLSEYASGLSRVTATLETMRGELTLARGEIGQREEQLAATAQAIGELQAERERHLHAIEALRQLAAAHRPAGTAAPATSGAPSVAGRLDASPSARRQLRTLREAARTPGMIGLIPMPGQRWHPSSIRSLVRWRQLNEARLIVSSGLFDAAYYRATNPDVASGRANPLLHYLTVGGLEGRNPHPLFDSGYYLRHNHDVAAAGINPLVHYVRTGHAEGRNPHPLFDVAGYQAGNPDVAGAGYEPLGHFLRFGANEGRQPNGFFDCGYYLHHNPDVAQAGMNPLVHFATDGWREGRNPSPRFDVAGYLAEHADIVATGRNPLEHYLEYGIAEGRRLSGVDQAAPQAAVPPVLAAVPLTAVPLDAPSAGPRIILCLSHVMPFPPRAGNEYRIYRMLCWLQAQGYRIVPIIAPLPGDTVSREGLRTLADMFSNAVLCDRDGRVEYVLNDVPDVLASLSGEPSRPVSLILDEQRVQGMQELELLRMDRAFCHDVAITVTTRLQQALGPHVLLAEYIWMSRILPLVRPDVLKVIDTIDVFSTKRDKVLRFGIDDLHVDEHEEAKRLRDADLVIAIQEDESRQLRRLMPDTPIVTAGVDFDVVADGGVPSGRQVLYVASGNPMNRKGLEDFLRFAWPQIRQAVPDAELMLVGQICEAIPADVPGVVRLGKVDDLTPLYRAARAVINPAVAGTGLKIKTLEALGHLRPVVTWPSGTDGVAPELAAFCEIVHDWYDFTRRVTALLASAEPRVFSSTERGTIVRLTSPAHVYAGLTAALDSAIAARSGADRRAAVRDA